MESAETLLAAPPADARKAGQSNSRTGRGAARASGTQEAPALKLLPSEPLYAGKIRLGEELGRGGMGFVLEGIDVELRRELAVKVMGDRPGGVGPEQVARFVGEAQVTAQLEHPNVVPVHELGVDAEGRAFFTMKRVRGRSLDAILEQRAAGDPQIVAEFGLRRLLDVFLDVCQAVEYAHARGVVHRDLKPANIMVGEFGEVLVMDWGVAKILPRAESLAATTDGPEQLPSSLQAPRVHSTHTDDPASRTLDGTVLGTPSYMAPEQAKGIDVDERADIYSLGAILYEILAGRPPFIGKQLMTLLTQVVSEEPPLPSRVSRVGSVPRVLERMSLRLLSKDPDRRNIPISRIRADVEDYIEGIARVESHDTLRSKLLWVVGGLATCMFLIWYLTGRSAASLLAPQVLLNAAGWFLLVVAIGYPLYAFGRAFVVSQMEIDRFRPLKDAQVFVAGFFAHRRFAASIAPLFQLVFLVDMSVRVVPPLIARAPNSSAMIQGLMAELLTQWYHALIVVFLFLFGYLYLSATEVRFARMLDHYEPVLRRSGWESVWPFFLIFALLATVATVHSVDWVLQHGDQDRAAHAWQFFEQRILQPELAYVDIVKTLVFQGTFLIGLLIVMLLLSYPFPELLAALRLPHQLADQAAVTSRSRYFLRSLSVYQVTRSILLYAGAMIGCLTAMTILPQAGSRPLLEELLYILAPSLLGFFGFAMTRSALSRHLVHAPALARLLERRMAASRSRELRALREAFKTDTWASRLRQFAVPLVCLAVYLLWPSTGGAAAELRELARPTTAQDWLTFIPYLVLLPLLLVRDRVQARFLDWRYADAALSAGDANSQA